MISGINLTLLIGPIVPLPAPRFVLDALQTVKVITAAGSPSGFELTFTINARSELNTLFLITAGQSSTPVTPPLRVMIVITMNATPTVLFDGVMTNAQVQTGGRGTPGTIVVTGEDLTKVMDLIDFS